MGKAGFWTNGGAGLNHNTPKSTWVLSPQLHQQGPRKFCEAFSAGLATCHCTNLAPRQRKCVRS